MKSTWSINISVLFKCEYIHLQCNTAVQLSQLYNVAEEQQMMMVYRKMTVILKQCDSVVPRLSGSSLVSWSGAKCSSFLHFGYGNEARLNVTTGSNLWLGCIHLTYSSYKLYRLCVALIQSDSILQRFGNLVTDSLIKLVCTRYRQANL